MNRKDFRPNNRNSNITKKDSDIIAKYKVKKKTIKGYYGMNNLASKEINIDENKNIPVPKKNTIFIAKSLKGKKRRKVIAHEVHENELMKKGEHYKVAHKKSLKYEEKIQ